MWTTCAGREEDFFQDGLDALNRCGQIVVVTTKSVKAPKRRNFPKTNAAIRKRMRSVPSTNTRLEQRVRSALRDAGFQVAARPPNLPGKPDVVLVRPRGVIFVHGCFWHGHGRCEKGRTLPKQNRAFWKQKIVYNRARDRHVAVKLRQMGWKVAVVWECQTRNPANLASRLSKRFGIALVKK